MILKVQSEAYELFHVNKYLSNYRLLAYIKVHNYEHGPHGMGVDGPEVAGTPNQRTRFIALCIRFKTVRADTTGLLLIFNLLINPLNFKLFFAKLLNF